ncbi:exonuclease [Oceaniferula spumae]|uniref:Exonuclease n=1 Tax=Oceaniferula spumae TaxID=2979115 RepID=A0AAT9FS29_9BACT
MLIAEQTFAAIDFESAGAERGMTDVPVQIGMATWSAENGHADHFTSFIHTERQITWAAQKVHGISSEDLADAPKLMLLWSQIKRTLADRIVVAHGHGTEKRYLRAFPAHGFGPWVDTLLLARAAWPELPSHSLGDLCEHFQLTEKVSVLVSEKTWHDALYDATASLVLLEHLIKTFELENVSVELLVHPDTSTWHRLRR